MTIRHWDAPCRILDYSISKSGKALLSIELLAPYGDGSSKKGQKRNNIPLCELNADGGWSEIFYALDIKTPLNRKEQLMSAIENSYDNKSLSELVEMYNSMVPKEKRIKKFRDRNTAIDKMTKAFQDPVVSNTADSPGEKKKVPAKLAQAATVVAQQFKIVGRKSNHSGKKIFKIQEENPRREGSHGYKNWLLYRDGMTYEEFVLAKGGAVHLNYDVAKGYVELK